MAPEHYTYSGIEPYVVAVDWNVGTEIHNMLKYICRRDVKGTYEGNQEKWRKYLEFAVQRGGNLMVDGGTRKHEIKAWQVELAWKLDPDSEECSLLWAIWHTVKSGGCAKALGEVHEKITGEALENTRCQGLAGDGEEPCGTPSSGTF